MKSGGKTTLDEWHQGLDGAARLRNNKSDNGQNWMAEIDTVNCGA